MRFLAVFTTFALLCGCSQLQQFSAERSVTEGQGLASTNVEPLSKEISFLADPDCLLDPVQLEQYAGAKHADLWSRLQAGYQLQYTPNPRIDNHRNWYAKHPNYMARVTERGNRYLFGIVEKLEARGMPYELALLPIVESAFDPFAYSHGRASGMWQFIPATGRRYGLDKNYWYDGRRDIEASTNAALDYLTDLHKRFNGDWLLALAAYNTGEGNVQKAIRRNRRAGKPTDFWSLRLPRETKAYVPQLLALSEIVMDPDAYQITLHPVEDKPFYEIVNVDSQIDLAKAAELAGIEMNALYYLNPAYNQWATDPGGPHKLLVPVDSADLFRNNLLQYPPEERLGWENYRVVSGDSLLRIAKKFKTTPAVIQQVNNLKGNLIREGQRLLIPMATESSDHYAYSEKERLARTQEKSSGKPGTSKVNYRVKAGDSLWEIAQAHKVNVRSLAKWNGMAPRDPLRIGQELVIWSNAKTNSTTFVAKTNNTKSPLVRKVAYRVRNGDSLSRIASKFKVSVNDIASWNSLSKNKYIHPGQNLTLWVDLTRAY
ncbi:LysM peptidoglycan-binding domain-containing protein [Aurantivibrio plasticivorans]